LAPNAAQALGIDIGGSGIKGAPVDLVTGSLTTARLRIPTPQPATVDAVAAVVAELIGQIGWEGPIGATFPAVIHDGIAMTAANVDPSWIGTDVVAVLSAAVGAPVSVLNDADAAGLAEMRVGAGRDVAGTVVMITFGTGIGSGLFRDGRLVPNTEFGHVELDGEDAERRAAESARDREHLSWPHWAKRVERYLGHLEMLLTPDLFIVGGGASKKADSWLPLVSVRTPIRVAELRNRAGIVGAALSSVEMTRPLGPQKSPDRGIAVPLRVPHARTVSSRRQGGNALGADGSALEGE
jgi:polyphosphate glucokinase